MPMSPQEQQLFEKAMQTIKAQQTKLEDLTAPVHRVGSIVAVFEKSAIVETDSGGTFECQRDGGTDPDWVGCTVQIHPTTGQIVKRSEYFQYGPTAVIMQIEGGLVILNSSATQASIVIRYSRVPIASLSVGDHVVLNSTNRIILEKVDIKSKQAFTTQAPLDWKDIGGCRDTKAELVKALELPYTHEAVFNFFHKQRVKGGVLWGRPGNGKTLLGRACAGSIARVHKAESVSTGFIYIKGPEVLSKWVGETEETIRTAFDQGKAHFKKFGYPAVLFIDEADALLTRRGTRTASGMEQTVVPQFCAMMDGMEDSGVFVLIATNRIEILDPAVIRPGRIDRRFYIGPPTAETAPEIFEIHMRNVPVADKCNKEQLIAAVNKAFFSQQYPLYKLETDKGTRIFTLGDLASGALITGVVERATSYAIDRNLDNPHPEGLTRADFDQALTAMHQEQFGLSHLDELREYVEVGKYEVRAFTQCRTAEEANAPVAAPLVAVEMPGSFMKPLGKKENVN